MTRVTITPRYDRQNAWLELLGPQPEPNVLRESLAADHVVIGAGFGGLAAARRLAELQPEAHVVLLEADRLANNAAGRCSGFIIDHAHNIRAKGFADDTDNATRQIALNRAGLDWLDKIVHNEGIDCDWRREGKIHAAASAKGRTVLDGFAASLDAVDEDYHLYDQAELTRRFGTDFYDYGLHAPHSVTVQPASLVLGLARTMPENVSVYESSMVTEFDFGPPHTLRTEHATITTPSVVIAANGFGEGFGFFRNRLLPMITWGSITRPLTDAEVRYWRGTPSRVTVSGTRSDGWTTIDIADTGFGMSRDLLARVFEPAVRGVAAEEFEGTGFGLAIVKLLVEGHDGRIELSSSPGEGTLARLQFPEGATSRTLSGGLLAELGIDQNRIRAPRRTTPRGT